MNKEQIEKEQARIGQFIKSIRKQKGLTQSDFAKLLETSQSAVARMERGGLNFSTQELIKIGNVLDTNSLNSIAKSVTILLSMEVKN